MGSNGKKNGKTKHLTSDKEAFCRLMAFESSTDLNQTEVYAKTHDTKKLTKKSMGELASRLMKDVKIMARIEELRKPVLDRFKDGYEDFLNELKALAFGNPKHLFDEHGNTIELPSLPDHVAKLVQGFEVQEMFIGKPDENRVPAGYTRKYRLVSKLDALEMFGKACGFFPSEKMALAAQLEIEEANKEVTRSIKVTFVHAPVRPSPDEPA